MDMGIIGLGVMGENLILNLIDSRVSVGIYNRTNEKTHRFVKRVDSSFTVGFDTLEQFVDGLTRESSRIILLMVKAGQPVDDFLNKLSGLLRPKDVVIDGGNSNYHDTVRRTIEYSKKFLFVGCGISGGEEGARHGASIMPGGDNEAWPYIKHILETISAKNKKTGNPCCEWIGPAGSGHLVKTVHNGIEYAEMQILSDFYQIFRRDKEPTEISDIFNSWVAKGTSGFLIEAMMDILHKKTDTPQTEDQAYLIDSIVDVSEQKGTGRWTVLESYNANVPVPSIAEAVIARIITTMKKERVELSQVLPSGVEGSHSIFELLSQDDIRKGFVLCKAIAYLQGFNLIRSISDKNRWNISLEMLCRVWSNGCIIRSDFLDSLANISKNGAFFRSDEFIKISTDGILPLRKIVGYCVSMGVSIPCIASSLSYYDAIRTEHSSGNIIQALRDYFGAHTVLLKGEIVPQHINWK